MSLIWNNGIRTKFDHSFVLPSLLTDMYRFPCSWNPYFSSRSRLTVALDLMSVSAFCLLADLMAFLHIAFPGIILWSVSIYMDCLTSSFIDATRFAIVTTALLFSSCVAPSVKSLLAYHKMKSSSLMLSSIFLLVQ